MQVAVVFFLALLVAHLLGDFAFQSRRMVDGKRRGERGAYLRHGATHLAVAYLSILVFLPAGLTLPRLHLAILAIVVVHLLCDWLKEGPLTASPLPSWLAFLADQVLHVLALALVTAVTFADFRPWIAGVYRELGLYREQILWVFVVYLGTTLGGGYLIRLLLAMQAPPPAEAAEVTDQAEQDRREKELRLGMYIGWLERLLVLSAILAKSPTAAGLIVAAKSIVRLKKLEKSDAFAEYFLLGTFLSILLALAGGLALRWLLWGTMDLE